MVRPTRSLVVTNRHIGRAPSECNLMKTEPLSVQIIGKSGFASCEATGRWLTLEPPPGLRVGWARPADLAKCCRAFNRKAPSQSGLPRNRASIARNPAILPRRRHGRRAPMPQQKIADQARRPVERAVLSCKDWHF